ncbi:Protoheme IX farnesyltransferase [Mycobacterium innocens]|uniref:Protoheme IX farnesyltransferase n=1 Tax=Mycobacterium innocens TaxID=2341083 RepID=A0A498PZL0_9MYCO|nr:UbiA family prenyltransferase [Mycobacterium innocens]VBA39268.1 Protoheme IX farnesyltransferase [Mycobacterium innocens]
MGQVFCDAGFGRAVKIKAYLDLMRAPAALTVLGDAAVGAIWAGYPLTGRRLALPLASALLYWSGMVLNDWADRERDAVERPERPIPSGEVSAGTALSVAAGLAGAGLATATAVSGRHGLAAAGRITLCVAAYDLVVKDTAAGPLVMAGCRFLDVMLGAGPNYRRALVPASVIGGHTTAITVLSRSEVTGSERRLPAIVGGMAVAVAASAMVSTPGFRAAPAAAVYAWSFGPGLWKAWQHPTAEVLRSAVRSGIASTIAVQAMLAAPAPRTMLALCGLAIGLRFKVSASRPTEVT